MRHTSSKLLTVAEAADLLSVSSRSVWQLIRSGRLPAVTMGPRLTRIKLDVIQSFIGELPRVGKAERPTYAQEAHQEREARLAKLRQAGLL